MWQWLDGKKTKIGLVFFVAGILLDRVVVGIWEYNPYWMWQLEATLKFFSDSFLTGGVFHKLLKDRGKEPPA